MASAVHEVQEHIDKCFLLVFLYIKSNKIHHVISCHYDCSNHFARPDRVSEVVG